MKEVVIEVLRKTLREKDISLSKEEISNLIETPPSLEMGDFAFPCFSLSRIAKKNPNEIASELKNEIKDLPKEIAKTEASGPYVNFFINKRILAKNLIKEILTKKENFGKNNLGKGKKFAIEFSQPNTHKAFHVGHIRGTSLGESISRISEFSGEKVIRLNYSGDTGMHVAKWLWCYLKFHKEEKLKKDESWIASIYVDSVKRLKENPDLQNEVNEINKKLESKEDKILNQIWKRTRKLSIDSWEKIYKELDVKFNHYLFESEAEKPGKEISLDLLKKGIAKKSDGAVIMDLENFNLGVWVLLRSDNTVLYSAKDFALAEEKIKKFKADKYLVLVADEQRLHFQQLVKTLELMNFPKWKDYNFLTFGLVRLPTGKMSSRTGDNILYSGFMNEIQGSAKQEIQKREEKISKTELEKRALAISIAAIKFSMLKQSPNKNIIFDKNEALKFEGDTGPYLLYSYARAKSILRKSKIKKFSGETKGLETKEIELVKKLSLFNEIVIESYKNNNPAVIANYSYQLAQTFNEFYHTCQVLKSEKESFRISLVFSFAQVLKNSLNLLGIKVIEKM
jgi:arginyl-tRNA synthetase